MSIRSNAQFGGYGKRFGAFLGTVDAEFVEIFGRHVVVVVASWCDERSRGIRSAKMRIRPAQN